MIVSPTVVIAVGDTVLVTANDGFRGVPVAVAEPDAVIAEPVGGVPVAVAVFVMMFAVRSCAVTDREPVHVTDAAGASVAGIVGEQLSELTFGSDTDTFVNVTFPVFVAVIV